VILLLLLLKHCRRRYLCRSASAWHCAYPEMNYLGEVFEYWEFENRWKKSFYLPWIALDEVGIHSWGSLSSGLVQRMSHAARSVGLLPWYTRHHHLVKASTVALLSYCWDFAAVNTCWSWEFVWFKRIRLSAVLTCRCGQRLIPTSRHRFLRAVTPTPSSLAASSIVELV
jgi:hypothetical protein